MEKRIENLSSVWLADMQLLITRLSGDVDMADIDQWEQSLHKALDSLEDGSRFKILVDLFGFEAVNVEAHKRYRDVIPLTLARYQWRVGYLDMFEEANGLPLVATRGIRCVGAAHVHQDATKIEKYQSLYSSPAEHFFTDPTRAYEWIVQLAI